MFSEIFPFSFLLASCGFVVIDLANVEDPL
jgi:hypothetical protein